MTHFATSRPKPEPFPQPPRVVIQGVPVSVVNLESATAAIFRAIEARESGYVCCCDVHGLGRAHDDPAFREVLANSYLTTPDGMPLVWIGRARGHRSMGRVYGPDLLQAVCAAGLPQGTRHFLYGGLPGVTERAVQNLQARHPGLQVVGWRTPPVGAIDGAELTALRQAIEAAGGADCLWVGLGLPRQEHFIAGPGRTLPCTLQFGIGAAFDYVAGTKPEAPRWLQNLGLQWLHRLATEPRRLAGRYARHIPRFLWRALWDRP